MNQIASRVAGENRARVTLLQLLCAVSIWRTAMTVVLPLCGAAAWWVTIICLLPGFAVTALLRLVLHLTQTETLTEGVRACLGKTGALVLSVVLAALLMTEGLAALTAMVTIFTQGVGTRGTAFTMTLLTGCALALSLHQDGLPRAAYFLRWPMAAAAAFIAACMLPQVRIDHVYPLCGEGDAAVITAMKAGCSLSWPVILFLTASSNPQGRIKRTVLPAFAPAAALLLQLLMVPQELLAGQRGRAAWLLLPAKYAPNALRILYLCLLMLTTFLSIAAAVQLAREHLCSHLKKKPVWLPYALLGVLALMFTGDVSYPWGLLSEVQPWLLLPLAALSILCLPIACIRRKCK
nr:hypothetical protein [Clostridia bacterium]